MIIEKIECDVGIEKIIHELKETLTQLGFYCWVGKKGNKIKISDVRVNVNQWGYNRSPHTGRRGNILNYYQWALVNYAVNVVLDHFDCSAIAHSLNKLFIIRDGKQRKTLSDWGEREFDNVGSLVNPVYRVEAWQPDDPERYNQKFSEAVDFLLTKYKDVDSVEVYLGRLKFHVVGK